MSNVEGNSTDPLKPGVLGTPANVYVPQTLAIGVKGDGGAGFPSAIPGNPAATRQAIGVFGTSADPRGIGVWGENTAGGNGVYGHSNGGNAGQFDGNLQVIGNASVSGIDPTQPGILGKPANVYVPQTLAIGVKGDGGAGFLSRIPGDPAATRQAIGVFGTSADPNGAGVWGENTVNGTGVYGRSNGGNAGLFDGKLQINGNVACTGDHKCGGTMYVTLDVVLGPQAQDCAEDFDVAESEVDAGTVVVITEGGSLQRCDEEYDRKVAGVISGAGGLRPGILLGREESQRPRMPVALVGRAYCKVDASYSPVAIGDLLTTSPTPGHAMRATDPIKSFGAVIGKALRPLGSGQGLIPILIALQ